MPTRRDCLALTADTCVLLALQSCMTAVQAQGALITRRVPKTGEELPIVGLGSSATFSQAAGQENLEAVRAVLQAMVGQGGKVFDTAPAYGASEEFTASIVNELDIHDDLFWATKLNVAGFGGGSADPAAARSQVEQSLKRFGRDEIDLIQVHNVADLPTQFPILREFKQSGRVRHVGATSTFKGQYETLERFIRIEESCDFIGIDYAVDNLSAEERILPLAQERGIAVLGYLPFGRTRLWQRVNGREVPAWAAEFGATTWAQFFLKFAASHPAMTVVTPATSRAEHMIDNMTAARGRLPNEDERRRMVEFVETLPSA